MVGGDSNAAKAFQQGFTDDHLVMVVKIDDGEKAARARAIPHHPARWTERVILNPASAYELRSICARSSAIEPNLTVPSGSLASIDPSV